MALVLQSGREVGQRYRLVRLLGEGGMGSVWAATHKVTRKAVALKFLKGAAAKDDVRRFLREARAASAVRHPNVVQIYDIFELDDGSPVMVMDLLVGESLGARLRREKKLPPAEVASILIPVVSAVGTAHAMGIVHRDLKPDNIFLVALPDGKHDVRVLDFGIAKLTASDGDAARTGGGLTQTGDMLGTPNYMAPEQASGELDIDHRTDIWALGIILYECLSGLRPVFGSNVGQILKRIITADIVPLAVSAPDLPKALTDLVGSMLAHERAGRPADLRPVQAVLAGFSAVSAPPFSEARPHATLPTPQPGEPLAEYAPTQTPTQFGKRKVDPEASHWHAATYSLESQPSAAPRRSRLGLWLGGGAAVLFVAGVAIQSTRTPSPTVLPAAAVPAAAVSATTSLSVEAPSPSPVAPPVVAIPVATPVEKKGLKHHAKSVAPPPIVAPAERPAPAEPARRLPGGVPEKAPY